MGSPRTRFDDQAAGFDERAGLGPEVARQVAAAITGIAGAGTVLELGPGTGELGRHLAAAARRYVGLDASFPMLAAFGPSPAALLVQADGGAPWPVRPRSVDLVFAARTTHLLEPAHVAAQVREVARPGATVLVGRVERPPDGLRNRLRARRRDLLAEHGLGGGNGRDRDRRLLDGLAAPPANRLPRRAAATWSVRTDAGQVIAHWEANGVAGGRPVPAATGHAIIDRLRTEFGGQSERETETYVLEGVRLP